MTEKFFTTTTDFSMHIEKLARELELTHLEAITHFCEETGAEYEAAASLVSPTLKQKIYDEAVKVYAMPKQTAITLDDF
jgi:uncharacterized protein YabE (DUF348 family)